jgi:kynurenine formamidase
MCDRCPERGQGWRGWIELPPTPLCQGTGKWLDLSHPMSAAMPRVPAFPEPRFSLVRSLPADPFNATEMQMVVHIGTHVDAPRHFFLDGPAFDEIPLDRLGGPGVVWRIDTPPQGLIDVADLEAARPVLQPGDILALDTGWAARFPDPSYEDHPTLSVAAAEWLVAQRVKLLAVDFGTPDLPFNRRGADFAWPVHHALLGNGVLICEHLTGHPPLAGKRAEFLFGALNIKGGDGAPARVMARPI